jgi:hypothetical protein
VKPVYAKRHGVLAGPNRRGLYAVHVGTNKTFLRAAKDAVCDKAVQNGGDGIRRQRQTPIRFQERTKAKK